MLDLRMGNEDLSDGYILHKNFDVRVIYGIQVVCGVDAIAVSTSRKSTFMEALDENICDANEI